MGRKPKSAVNLTVVGTNKPKSDGAQIRAVTSGPDVEHDELISFAADRNLEDAKRASSAGESRSKIKVFLDKTKLHPRAMSVLRSILKLNNQGEDGEGQVKAMDYIRSLEVGLAMVKAHVSGQGTTEMDFNGGTVNVAGEDAGGIEEDVTNLGNTADSGGEAADDGFESQLAAVGGGDPEIEDEAREFDAALVDAALDQAAE